MISEASIQKCADIPYIAGTRLTLFIFYLFTNHNYFLVTTVKITSPINNQFQAMYYYDEYLKESSVKNPVEVFTTLWRYHSSFIEVMWGRRALHSGYGNDVFLR